MSWLWGKSEEAHGKKPTAHAEDDLVNTEALDEHKRREAGGVRFTNEAELGKQGRIVMAWLKKLGGEILTGQIPNFMEVGLPLQLFQPRTILQRFFDDCTYAPIYLLRAARSKNPVERMQCVIAFVIAGLHLNVGQRRPITPLKGETFQITMGDGVEGISKKTEVSAGGLEWELRGPGYRFHGAGEIIGSIAGNSVYGHRSGDSFVEFDNGDRISFTAPHMSITGIMYGERYVEYIDTADFVDEKNHLSAELQFNPDGVGFVMSFFKAAATASDMFKCEIKNTAGNGTPRTVSTGVGSWLEHCTFDGKRLWDIATDPSGAKLCNARNPLSTDSTHRPDLPLIRSYKWAEAEACQKELYACDWPRKSAELAAAH